MTLSLGGRPTASGTSKQSHKCLWKESWQGTNSLTCAVSLHGCNWIKILSAEDSLCVPKWLPHGSTKQHTSLEVHTAKSLKKMHNTQKMAVMLGSFNAHPVNLMYTSYKKHKTFFLLYFHIAFFHHVPSVLTTNTTNQAHTICWL